MRRLVGAGAELAAGFDVWPAVADGPEPFRDELVARIVDVIEVPYLKPIAPRFRRARVSCPIVWRSAVDAPIADVADSRVGGLDLIGPPGHAARSEPDPEVPDVDLVPDVPAARPGAIWPAAGIGAVAACAYVPARVTTAGLHVLGGSLPVGIALLVASVVAAGVLSTRSRFSTDRSRLAAAIGIAVVFAAAVAAGAGALPHA